MIVTCPSCGSKLGLTSNPLTLFTWGGECSWSTKESNQKWQNSVTREDTSECSSCTLIFKHQTPYLRPNSPVPLLSWVLHIVSEKHCTTISTVKIWNSFTVTGSPLVLSVPVSFHPLEATTVLISITTNEAFLPGTILMCTHAHTNGIPQHVLLWLASSAQHKAFGIYPGYYIHP